MTSHLRRLAALDKSSACVLALVCNAEADVAEFVLLLGASMSPAADLACCCCCCCELPPFSLDRLCDGAEVADADDVNDGDDERDASELGSVGGADDVPDGSTVDTWW